MEVGGMRYLRLSYKGSVITTQKLELSQLILLTKIEIS
jgi:hypothetical protein